MTAVYNGASAARGISISYERLWLKRIMPLSGREIKLALEEMRRELASLYPDFSKGTHCFICTDAYMEDLNQSFLNTPGPTNTLAFEAAGHQIAGDAAPVTGLPQGRIYFCAPQFERETMLYGQNPADYAIFLLAHAMAHLTGLDHGGEMDRVSEKLVLAGRKAVQTDSGVIIR